jgi:N-acetylglucosaminyldiphosphoundecaprenol N-acetyl-beta-D-mannosaminyltransferase
MTFRDVVMRSGLRLGAPPHRASLSNRGLPQASSGLKDLAQIDDLSRPVFGVLGIPIDVLDFATLIEKILAAVEAAEPFLLSTPNVNFLMLSRSDTEFREALLMSDLCPADGMPILWIARLLGIPIRERLSGSDLFEMLRSDNKLNPRLKVFLFGGAENAAETVCKRLNGEAGGMVCVGALNPGFGSVADMSTPEIIETIQASQADLLAVFLSARKAQDWLRDNHSRLQVPVRAQLGATINIQAGVLQRAPIWIQRAGFEWLWRIKEEPYLWQRYWDDGRGLLYLMLTSVLPLVASRVWRDFILGQHRELVIDRSEDRSVVVIRLSGGAVSQNVDMSIPFFRESLRARKPIRIDISELCAIDARFFGLLLMIRKQLISQGLSLVFSGSTPWAEKTFRLNGFEFLLNRAR